eukprot:m.204527 g.204527  ORF g.204527 m.204527 type:complete len:281 (+) comp39650_c0_seq2:242-1084(+)
MNSLSVQVVTGLVILLTKRVQYVTVFCFFLALNCCAMAEALGSGLLDRNYYDVLSVGLNATTDEIKKKYRGLARDFHPDKSCHPLAGEIMSKINRAYSVLMDKTKREEYDEKLGDDEETVGDLDVLPDAFRMSQKFMMRFPEWLESSVFLAGNFKITHLSAHLEKFLHKPFLDLVKEPKSQRPVPHPQNGRKKLSPLESLTEEFKGFPSGSDVLQLIPVSTNPTVNKTKKLLKNLETRSSRGYPSSISTRTDGSIPIVDFSAATETELGFLLSLFFSSMG